MTITDDRIKNCVDIPKKISTILSIIEIIYLLKSYKKTTPMEDNFDHRVYIKQLILENMYKIYAKRMIQNIVLKDEDIDHIIQYTGCTDKLINEIFELTKDFDIQKVKDFIDKESSNEFAI